MYAFLLNNLINMYCNSCIYIHKTNKMHTKHNVQRAKHVQKHNISSRYAGKTNLIHKMRFFVSFKL